MSPHPAKRLLKVITVLLLIFQLVTKPFDHKTHSDSRGKKTDVYQKKFHQESESQELE